MVSSLSWKNELLGLSLRYAERTAVYDATGSASYATIFKMAAGIAKAIVNQGIAPGDPVGTLLPNGRYAVAGSYGVVLSGAGEAAINAHLSPDDLAHCLDVAGVRHVVTTADTAAALSDRFPKITFLAVERIADADVADIPDRRPANDAFGKILFTSGTTGKPKGIVHSQIGRWLANLVLRASLPVAPGPDLNLLLLTPFSHGSSLLTYAYLDGGATITLLDRVDVPDIIRRLENDGINQIFAPPTVLRKLVDGMEGKTFPAVKTIFCGTAPLSKELYERAREIFGPVVRLTYGKTEIFNPITILSPQETDDWFREGKTEISNCVGWPGPGVEICIGDADEDSNEAKPDAEDGGGNTVQGYRTGPVLIRARHAYHGTLKDGSLVLEDPNAFHRSGDVGFIDDKGRVHLCGREASVIKSGGYRINPEEVEAGLRQAKPDMEVVVVGLPSEYWGEIITAVAVGVEDGWGSELPLDHITKFKRPRFWLSMPEIPKNSIGKIMRNLIIDHVSEHYVIVDGPYPKIERR
jgi:acyl-coenzyme A synthetase/AMP-(fatty) acid ligase